MNSRAFGATALLVLVAALHSETARAFDGDVILEDPGIIKAAQGSQCVTRKECGTGGSWDFSPCGFVASSQSLALPEYADNATVVLNGVRARYASGAHNLSKIEVSLSGIGVAGGELSWTPQFTFVEDSGAEREICYVYIAIGWNSRRIDARRITEDQYIDFPDSNKYLDTWGIASGNVTQQDSTVVLPAGFSLKTHNWRPRHEDRHLYQLAYALGQIYFPTPGEARWDSAGIIKDKRRRKQTFSSSASVLTGSSVGVIQGAYQLDVSDPCGGFFQGCIGPGLLYKETFREEMEDSSRGHDYVIPMLTGFDLHYTGDDHQVSELGAWIDQAEFNQDNDVLRYRVNTLLTDGKNGFLSSHAVTLLTFDEFLRSPRPNEP